MQFRQGAGYRERQLGAGAKPGVFGKRALDTHMRTGIDSIVSEEPPREVSGAVGTLTGDLERLGMGGRETQRGSGRGRTDTAEPSAERSAEIEDAEVKPRRYFDEDRAAHNPATARGADRT